MGERTDQGGKHMEEREQTQLKRRSTLVELLDRWKDFFDEPGGEPGPMNENADEQPQSLKDYSAFSAMGRSREVVELRRCVEMLERMGPAHYRHLMAYTACAEWRIVCALELKRVGAFGEKLEARLDPVTKQPIVDPDPKKMRRERVAARWVSSRMVDTALDFILGVWDSDVPLQLPKGMRKGMREYVNPETGEVGWTQAA